ncbi:MAG TPA: hypothetical protein PLD02_02370 [Saprospiraceae bacterium]|nr:hypothetical protein [Saprospiraceae bacterium]
MNYESNEVHASVTHASETQYSATQTNPHDIQEERRHQIDLMLEEAIQQLKVFKINQIVYPAKQ